MKKKNNNKIFIIAEAGVNHNGDIKKALKLVEIAKKAGADAVKFQLFSVDEQVSSLAKNAPYQVKGSKKKNMTEMAKDYEFSWNNHLKIKKLCDKIKIEYLASCCDINAINFLIDKIKAKKIKISSGEITNYKLIEFANRKKVPIILSTGMATLEEIKQSVKYIKNKKKLTLLHCVSNYPTELSDLNLSIINNLKKTFKCKIGFSDHTIGTKASFLSVALGISCIEKHFTINKKLKGPDHAMSLSPNELKSFVNEIRLAEKILGNKSKKNISKKEKEIKKIARRGIISVSNIKRNEKFTSKNIAIKRPLLGIDAKFFDKIINKKAKKNIEAGERISLSKIKI